MSKLWKKGTSRDVGISTTLDVLAPQKVMIFIAAIILLKGSMLRFTSCKTIYLSFKERHLVKTTNHMGWNNTGPSCATQGGCSFPHEKHVWFDLNTSKQHSQCSFLGQAVGLSRVAVKGTVKGREGLSSENGLRNDWPSNNGCIEDLRKRFVSFWPPYFEPSIDSTCILWIDSESLWMWRHLALGVEQHPVSMEWRRKLKSAFI